MQEVFSWISACLLSDWGVKVVSPDPDKLRQAVERAIRVLPQRPPISFLTRHDASGPSLWLVKNEFMIGKKLDYDKIRALYEGEDQGPCVSPQGHAGGNPGDLPPHSIE